MWSAPAGRAVAFRAVRILLASPGMGLGGAERVVSSLDIAKLLVFDPRKALRHAPHFIARPPRAADVPQAASDA